MPTASTSQERIAHILNQRKPFADRVQQQIDQLGRVRSALEALSRQRARIVKELGATGSPDARLVIHQLEAVNLDALLVREDAERQRLRRFHARVARPTINLGVIGLARQGKSRLLQTISGLDDDQIPTSNRDHCTAVRSQINHVEGSSTYANVAFFNEREFLEGVIAPSYASLDLGNPPFSVRDMALPLPPLPADLAGVATRQTEYDNLRSYFATLARYQDFLNQTDRQVPRERIREFVAYHSNPKTAAELTYYEAYRAVKRVEVICQFPRAKDYHSLGLVDLPGLGRHNVRDRDLLKSTLADQVDFVIFLKLPATTGAAIDQIDTDLYGIARQAIPELPIEKWAYFVLNRRAAPESNEAQCADCLRQVPEKHIQVLESKTVDCSNEEEVDRLIVVPALDYLMANLVALDRQYGQAAQTGLADFSAMASATLAAAERALGVSPDVGGDIPLFNRLFEKFWLDLALALAEELKALDVARQTETRELTAAVELVLNQYREESKLPSEAEINQLAAARGGYLPALSEFLLFQRATLSSHISQLDVTLTRLVADLKARILAHFSRLLGHLLAPGTTWADLEGLVSATPSNNVILPGLRQFAAFDLSYRGFVQHRVRKVLDCLAPDTALQALEGQPVANAADVIRWLRYLSIRAADGVELAFQEWSAEPNQAAFAAVEELVDLAIRANGARQQWSEFLAMQADRVWPGEFSALREQSALRKYWREEIARAKTELERIPAI